MIAGPQTVMLAWFSVAQGRLNAANHGSRGRVPVTTTHGLGNVRRGIQYTVQSATSKIPTFGSIRQMFFGSLFV